MGVNDSVSRQNPEAPKAESYISFLVSPQDSERKENSSSLLSSVYVTEVEFMWLDPCFLGKSVWLMSPLSSGTGTDVEG